MREEFYDPDVKPGLGEVIVAKQRNGPTGSFEVAFLSEFARFEPASGETPPRDIDDDLNF